MKQIIFDLEKISNKELKEGVMDRKEWRNISSLNQSTD